MARKQKTTVDPDAPLSRPIRGVEESEESYQARLAEYATARNERIRAEARAAASEADA